MKLIVIFLLITISSSAFSQRDVISRESLVNVMRTLSRGASPGFVNACAEDLGPTRIYQCGNKRPKVILDVANTSIKLNKMLTQVRAYYRNRRITSSPERLKQINDIKATLECMQGALREDLSVKCGRCEGRSRTRGYVSTVGPAVLHTITVCPKYFDYNNNFRSGTITHELSHMCGTEDYDYFFDNTGRAVTAPKEETQLHLRLTLFGEDIFTIKSIKSSATFNADNYHYWAENGFCLPNYDCGPVRN